MSSFSICTQFLSPRNFIQSTTVTHRSCRLLIFWWSSSCAVGNQLAITPSAIILFDIGINNSFTLLSEITQEFKFVRLVHLISCWFILSILAEIHSTLHLEHQMAEELIDSGISSDYSSLSSELTPSTSSFDFDLVDPIDLLCAKLSSLLYSRRLSQSILEGQYGLINHRLPYNSPKDIELYQSLTKLIIYIFKFIKSSILLQRPYNTLHSSQIITEPPFSKEQPHIDVLCNWTFNPVQNMSNSNEQSDEHGVSLSENFLEQQKETCKFNPRPINTNPRVHFANQYNIGLNNPRSTIDESGQCNYVHSDYAYLAPLFNRIQETAIVPGRWQQHRSSLPNTPPRTTTPRTGFRDTDRYLLSPLLGKPSSSLSLPEQPPDKRERPSSRIGSFTSSRWSDTGLTVVGSESSNSQRSTIPNSLRDRAATAAAAAAVAVAALQQQTSSAGDTGGLQRRKIDDYQSLQALLTAVSLSSGRDEQRKSQQMHTIDNRLNRWQSVLNHWTRLRSQNKLPHQHRVDSATVDASMIPSSTATYQTTTSDALDIYANYQSLEALLGQTLLNRPPPPQPAPTMLQDHDLFGQEPSHRSVETDSRPKPSTSHNLEYKSPADPYCRQAKSPLDKKLDDFSDFRLLKSQRCLSRSQTPDLQPTNTIGQLSGGNIAVTSPTTTTQQTPSASTSSPSDGLLTVNLIAGNGLCSSQVVLRDIYCVIEIDSIRKARSMIRTSTSHFEWKEMFELELETSRFLVFLLYQWDARVKHRLCFYGGIDIQRLLTFPTTMSAHSSNLLSSDTAFYGLPPHSFDKIALQLEPRGLLYIEFSYYTLEQIFHRYHPITIMNPIPPTKATSTSAAASSDGILFGVPISELVDREKLMARLCLDNDIRLNVGHSSQIHSSMLATGLHIPLFIRKCVEEIERRGIDVVGIYRLAGSVWMKLQVRELFNRITRSILRALFQGDHEAINDIASSIDLSPERVPDIHAITALFKDFLRELPEPLFTSSLYPMFHDAIQLTMPGFSRNGAKLMLNILDCLPTTNQEVLLYLLDHFKRVVSNCNVNRMDASSLASCLAPALFYPAPSTAHQLDPGILHPGRMSEIFKFILTIWPEGSRAGGGGGGDRQQQEGTDHHRGHAWLEKDDLTEYVPLHSTSLRSRPQHYRRHYRSQQRSTSQVRSTRSAYTTSSRSPSHPPPSSSPRVRKTYSDKYNLIGREPNPDHHSILSSSFQHHRHRSDILPITSQNEIRKSWHHSGRHGGDCGDDHSVAIKQDHRHYRPTSHHFTSLLSQSVANKALQRRRPISDTTPSFESRRMAIKGRLGTHVSDEHQMARSHEMHGSTGTDSGTRSSFSTTTTTTNTTGGGGGIWPHSSSDFHRTIPVSSDRQRSISQERKNHPKRQ